MMLAETDTLILDPNPEAEIPVVTQDDIVAGEMLWAVEESGFVDDVYVRGFMDELYPAEDYRFMEIFPLTDTQIIAGYRCTHRRDPLIEEGCRELLLAVSAPNLMRKVTVLCLYSVEPEVTYQTLARLVKPYPGLTVSELLAISMQHPWGLFDTDLKVYRPYLPSLENSAVRDKGDFSDFCVGSVMRLQKASHRKMLTYTKKHHE